MERRTGGSLGGADVLCMTGIVFMRRNHESGSYRPIAQQGSAQPPASGDPFSDL